MTEQQTIREICETALEAIVNADTSSERIDIQEDAMDVLCAIPITSANSEQLRDVISRLDMTDVSGDITDGIWSQTGGMDAMEDSGDIAHSVWMED